MLLMAEVPAEPMADICGKGSCRHRRNRAIVPRNDKEPHSISSEMPLRLFPSNVCMQDYENSRHRQEIPLSTNTPREGKMNPLWSGTLLPLLSTLFKYTVKGFASDRERWTSKKTTVFCNVCVTRVLSVLTAKSQEFQLSRYFVTCWHILIGQ